ncbi:MAG TPA: DUF2586 family protein [Saprospiraceae bacterium]|nr:DUF2586 family protein [Saprospiraceae bacterium]HRP41958.1 DUF2586 family protein [Saprospiraceae bacterium]
MALNNVYFETVAGGLGRLPEGEDHVSCLIYKTSSPSTVFGGLIKSYEEAEQNVTINNIMGSDPVLAFQIREYFQMAGPSELYVILEATSGGVPVTSYHTWTKGRVRQIYWHRDDMTYTNVLAKVAEAGVFATALNALFIPAVILLSVKDHTKLITDNTLPILHQNDNPEVSVLISGDGSGAGNGLADLLTIKYIPAGGALLGLLSKAAVHESIGWVRKFPLAYKADGVNNYEKTRFSDGSYLPGGVTETTLETLSDKGYIFLRQIEGVPGVYVNDTHTACDETSDYRYIENNRTIHKAKRGIRASLLPDLNSPIEVTADGTLSADMVAYFVNQTSRPLNLMLNAGEISAFEVIIDPDQDILTTSILNIDVKIVPRGTARTIKVNIGYAVSVGQ